MLDKVKAVEAAERNDAEEAGEQSEPAVPHTEHISLIQRLAPQRLTSRIVLLNLLGLAILVAGILYFNQFRQGLIDARVQSSHDAGAHHFGRRGRLGHHRHRIDRYRSRFA
ncbi:sensor N-terminal transmembrane domain-containing protein [Aestuariivirga sp.]|uniref:sensor N-terminal transmembrane domain-containing protein n=1 Tax=Aestuariivirga sp. TaxID=2650926 RepID=UPI0039E3F4DE